MNRGRGLGYVTYFLIFEPPIMYGRAEATNFKFSMQILGKHKIVPKSGLV